MPNNWYYPRCLSRGPAVSGLQADSCFSGRAGAARPAPKTILDQVTTTETTVVRRVAAGAVVDVRGGNLYVNSYYGLGDGTKEARVYLGDGDYAEDYVFLTPAKLREIAAAFVGIAEVLEHGA